MNEHKDVKMSQYIALLVTCKTRKKKKKKKSLIMEQRTDSMHNNMHDQH